MDNSCYNDNYPILNRILEIKIPGSCCFVPVTLPENFCSITLDCEDFNLCCNVATKSPFPDGVYEIKYSVDPNLSTMVEYNHFRVCNLWKTFLGRVCKIRNSKADYTKNAYENILKNLHAIRNTILDAVVLAEECLDVDGAMKLYNEAKTLLNDESDCPTC